MAAPPALSRGIVKQVLSGDAVIVRGQPRGGPPPERTVCLSNVTAPRLARRPNPNIEGSSESRDEPYAWEAREFLRKKLIGREVCFQIEYKTPAAGREYGFIYVGKDASGENVTETMINEGLVEVRRGGVKAADEAGGKLIALEEAARAAGKGKWGPEEEVAKHVRDVKWTVEQPRHLLDSLKGKANEAVIEHVRDGCTIRAFILPSFQYVTVMLTGVKAPMFKIEGDKTTPEPFAEEAKYFTESRLLQRDVHIQLEGSSNQNLIGSVIHPNGNIAELMLKEGYARCADWSMAKLAQGAEKYRSAEKVAKEKKLRLWKDYNPAAAGPIMDIKEKNFQAKVVEIINGDGMMLKMNDGSFKKIFLSSIRPPRQSAEAQAEQPRQRGRSRALYDVPYMFEAREFLRKRLIGKKISVNIDYIQPKSDEYPEKVCCTVTINGINIAEALVGKGLATVVRYRQDDDKRSSQYDDLLSAQDRAENKSMGLHSKKEPPVLRVADISGDVTKAKQFFPFLQRAGRSQAVVEYVASGSRLRLYIPRETCLITFLLAGIDCPRGSRPVPGGGTTPADPFGEEALLFTKEHVLQREVEVEVESMDKGGNFIGWMFAEGLNMSVGLVEEGYAKIHFSAERSNFYKILSSAEAKAKGESKNTWANYEEPKEEAAVLENEPTERKVNYKTVVVTEISDDMTFYAQNAETGPELEKLMEQIRTDFAASPPLAGSYSPKKGELCAAKFTDGEWYRARVEKISGHQVHLLYVDYGNREMSDTSRLATLTATYQQLPLQARHYTLACIGMPPEEDDVLNAVDFAFNEFCNKEVLLNTEYKNAGVDYVTIQHTDNKEDIGKALITAGYVLAENRREKRLNKLVKSYQEAQDKAKKSRAQLWKYGDFMEDDAKEFGFRK